MKAGELTINGRDAFKTYGLFMTAAGLAALKAPRTPKEPVTCESRLEHGKRVILPQPGDAVKPLFESREFNMEVNMTAKTAAQFEANLAALETALTAGWLKITTTHKPGTIYHCRYLGTSSFAQYGRAAKMTLKFEEPNPGLRV